MSKKKEIVVSGFQTYGNFANITQGKKYEIIKGSMKSNVLQSCIILDDNGKSYEFPNNTQMFRLINHG